MKKSVLIPWILLVVLSSVLGYVIFNQATGASSSEAAVRQLVLDFGKKLQNVSLLAPADNLKAAIEENYFTYVSPELLAVWEKDPMSAPGRLTSSPWPDRIEITSVGPAASGDYEVRGGIVEITRDNLAHGSSADSRPVIIRVGRINGAWKIKSFAYGSDYADQSKWKAWQSVYYTKPSKESIQISLQYPRDFERISGPELGYPSYLDAQSEMVFSFPEDAFRQGLQNNFRQAYLALSVKQNTDENSCFAFRDALMTDTTTMNGVEFRTASSTEGAAGSVYETRVYRTLYRTRCVELAETVATTNIGNYDPGTVVEFDKSRAWSVLDKIVGSFRVSEKTGPGM